MRRHRVGNVEIELVSGDITAQPDVNAVVNAANAQFEAGGGVPGAIHGAAGRGWRRSAGSLPRPSHGPLV